MSANYDELSILEYSGQLQADVSQAVRSFALQWNANLFDAILETHVLSEHQLRNALARALQLPTSDDIELPNEWRPYADLIDYQAARTRLWLCGPALHGKTGSIAFIGNPISLTDLKQQLGDAAATTEFHIAERSEVVRAIDLYYPLISQLQSFT